MSCSCSFGVSVECLDDQHRIQQMLGLGSSEASTEAGSARTPRETIVKYMMNEREDEFTDITEFKLVTY